jgi:hypothetical protein
MRVLRYETDEGTLYDFHTMKLILGVNNGRAGEIDHLRPDQSDQLGRFKLTTPSRVKLTT